MVWGNTQIFLPISLVMIGGWLIDRETNQDTMKNLVTVPLSMPALLGGKLIVVAGLAGGFGLYSGAVTVAAGAVFGLPGMSLPAVLGGCGQIFCRGADNLRCLPASCADFWADTGRLPGRIDRHFLRRVLHPFL